MADEIFVAKMTDFMEEAVLIAWLASEGEQVEEGQAIAEIETDKAIAELPAPSSGFLKGVRAGAVPGARIPVGETIAYVVASMDEAVDSLDPL